MLNVHDFTQLGAHGLFSEAHMVVSGSCNHKVALIVTFEVRHPLASCN